MVVPYRLWLLSAPSERSRRNKTNLYSITIWLVVSTPLKNISQLGLLFPIHGKIKNVPNHQSVTIILSLPHTSMRKKKNLLNNHLCILHDCCSTTCCMTRNAASFLAKSPIWPIQWSNQEFCRLAHVQSPIITMIIVVPGNDRKCLWLCLFHLFVGRPMDQIDQIVKYTVQLAQGPRSLFVKCHWCMWKAQHSIHGIH